MIFSLKSLSLRNFSHSFMSYSIYILEDIPFDNYDEVWTEGTDPAFLFDSPTKRFKSERVDFALEFPL